MKTFVKVLALSLVAVMMCAVLVSCGGPNKDPQKAADALEAAGYEVDYTEVDALGVKALVSAEKIDEEAEKIDFIEITYYEDNDKANEAWEKAQDTLDEAKAAMALLCGCDESEIVAKKSGSMIYIGTKAAVKAAK